MNNITGNHNNLYFSYISNYKKLDYDYRIAKTVDLCYEEIIKLQDGISLHWVIIDKYGNYIYSAQTTDVKNERKLITCYHNQDKYGCKKIVGRNKGKRVDQIFSYGEIDVKGLKIIEPYIDCKNRRYSIMLEESITDVESK